MLKANCSSFFQTALLVSGDPGVAEAAVVAAMNDLDVLPPPSEEDLGELHKTVAIYTIRRLAPQDSSDVAQAHSMLQHALWPLLHVERSPRVCFVLRMLLGCALSSCAQILGTEESHVRALLQIAILQLCHASKDGHPEANNFHSAKAMLAQAGSERENLIRKPDPMY